MPMVHRSDMFYHMSKEAGYRSRAAFKLSQLDDKYSFLSDAHAVLDLCAAPGGWMQVAVQRISAGSLVVGVDLDPIRPVTGAFAVQEDITHSNCRSTVKRLLADNHADAFDVILHDGAPNLGGTWTQTVTSQNALVVESLKLATEFLAPKGTFITKIFTSQDYNELLFYLRQLFKKVEVTKPEASRSTSAEIYIVCRKYKAPAKIDPRLLDIKHLFKEAIEPEKVIDVLSDIKQKRSRDSNLNLGTTTLTTEEIEAFCDDLRVPVKDFKQLLKWSLNIRKGLSTSKAPSVSESKDDEGEMDEDEKMFIEMTNLTHDILEVKKKREQKIHAKRRAKGEKDLRSVDDGTEDAEYERMLYDKKLEMLLDEAYERFVARREGSRMKRKRSEKRMRN